MSVDQGLVTSRSPADLEAFNAKFIELGSIYNNETNIKPVNKKGLVYISQFKNWKKNDITKSDNGGKTWLKSELPIGPHPGGWAYKVPGILRTNGLPILLCDHSNGPNRGTLYLNWTDQRNGEDNTDVWLSKSINNGESWSKPIKVNQDKGKSQQFFSWMAIDQSNGNLYFVFCWFKLEVYWIFFFDFHNFT